MYWNTHTYCSLRYGTLSPEQLVDTARQQGVQALGLTDINSSMGMIDFVRTCRENHIKPIAGIEFRDRDRLLYIGLAMNNEGFRELNEFLSEHNLNKTPLPDRPRMFSNVYIIYPYGSIGADVLKDHEYIGVRPGEVHRLLMSKYRYNQDKLLVHQPVSFSGRDGHFLHQNLRAIAHNIVISRLRPEQTAAPDEYMKPVDELRQVFADYPIIMENTERLMDSCSIDFDFQTIKNKQTFTGSIYDDRILLEKLSLGGLEYRYRKDNREAERRLRQELDIINRMGFAAYFLITWDIIRYSMSRGYYHVGRGSGANSVVAYCLKITDVDPIELDLYFERFINPKRSNPPDFDIDYSWRERDDVQDYIFKRYGRRHTALLGATSTFKGKSIYRELGKVYGLPKGEIDQLIMYPDSPVNNNAITRKIHSIARMMVNFPNIRSIHAGGVLISEKPLSYYTALDMPPKGFPTTQWDMYVAEDIGFEKLDILSQRGIGHIRDCVDIIAENRGTRVDPHQVGRFKEDTRVRKLLKRGETNGCFYIESPAMRGLLNKLRCDNYLGLVAASSIIRPGVARSGMMREYIHRFHNPNGFEYIHPVMEEQLKETFGVMVYQEDVLKICHHFAGLDLADSDVLRRAMSGKYRGKREFERIVKKFFLNCKQRGYSDEITNEVWRQIESFAGYSFSKAHSASYAVESFQSLYLKAYYPLEFMVAVINNFGGFYSRWVYFNEARRWGGIIQLPCVNNSDYKTNIRGKYIFIGFVHMANLETKLAGLIETERARNGTFSSLSDFIHRVRPGIEQLVLLIRVGAMRFTGKPKAHLLWEAHLILGKQQGNAGNQALFNSPVKKFRLPQLESSGVEDTYDEIEILGFPVTMTYFELLQEEPESRLMAKDLPGLVGKRISIAGLLVTIKYTRTVKREIMNFAAFLDRSGEFFDTVHFPDALKRSPFRGNGVYLIHGKVVEEFGFPSIEVQGMTKLPLKKDPRS
jgi:DNA polymerase-3 subunit alpha